jgi:hypothetical protein
MARETEDKPPLYQEALKCLEEAAKCADPWMKEAFCAGDCQSDPDLTHCFQQLAGIAEFSDRFSEVAAKIRGVSS